MQNRFTPASQSWKAKNTSGHKSRGMSGEEIFGALSEKPKITRNSRTIAMTVFFSLSAACATPHGTIATEGTAAVEAAILWEARLDETWKPVEMAQLVENRERFEPEGNFYRVKGKLVVFGHPALYVGMVGVDMFAGPNAVLQGRPNDIARYITKTHGIQFTKASGGFVCNYKKNVNLIIAKHPSLPRASIIIGAYTGP